MSSRAACPAGHIDDSCTGAPAVHNVVGSQDGRSSTPLGRRMTVDPIPTDDTPTPPDDDVDLPGTDPGVAALGHRTGGVWTRAEACRVRSAGEVDALLRSGTWQVVWPGAYADGGFVLSPEQLGHAAVLASGGADQPVPFGQPRPRTGTRRRGLVAVAAGRTAARHWGMPLIDDDDPATGAEDWRHSDVAVRMPSPALRYGGQVLHRRQLSFGAGDLVQTTTGLWTTTALRTLLDCRLLLSHEALVCALDDALHRRLVTPDRLEQTCRRVQGWRGAPAFRRAVALAEGRAESPGETLVRLLLLPVLPSLEPQVPLFDHAARPVAEFDLGDEDLRLAVEFDGRRGHAGDAMVAKDRRRDRRTGDLGWTTERVTWFEVRRRQEELRARIVRCAELLRRARVTPAQDRQEPAPRHALRESAVGPC